MLGHVTLRTSDVTRLLAVLNPLLAELGHEFAPDSDDYIEWGAFGIAAGGAGGRAATTGFHVGLLAEDREQVDRFHARGLELGCTDDGAPGLRSDYGPGYYGGFLRTFEGWSVEAVCGDGGAGEGVHHISLGVGDIEAARPFLRHVAELVGWGVRADEPDRIRIGADDDARLSLIADGRPASRNVHCGFEVDDVDAVHRFHHDLLAAGWTDDGAAGPRPQYSKGYYGGFILGPDGNSYEAYTRVT